MLLGFVATAIMATFLLLSGLHLVLLSNSAASVAAVGSNLPKGVDAGDAAAYNAGSGVFVCGEKTLLFSYVNDDFCDCPDGSDEPGTSACSGASLQTVTFFCRNEAFQPRRIAVSRVGDGLCDCCDGSDETIGVCEDTCAAEKLKWLDATRAERERFEKGAKERARYVKVAEGAIAEHQTELQRARDMLAKAEASKEELSTRASDVEARENTQKASLLAAAQRDAQVRLGLHLLSHERLLEMVVRLVRDAEQGLGTERAASIAALAAELADVNCSDTTVGCDPSVLAQDASENAQADAAAEEAKRAKEEAAAAAAAAAAADESTSDDGDSDAEDTDLDTDADEQAEETPEARHSRLLRERVVRSFDDASGFELPEAVTFREQLAELEKSQKELEKGVNEKAELLEKVDYGPDNVWFAIRDACFDTDLHGYKWDLCPLKSIKQDSVSLGKFVRWENDHSTMVFENGQRCWNGPERSAVIDLACGADSELVAMEEPSKCVYKGRFLTPLMCV